MISVYVDDNELRILSVEEYHQMNTRGTTRVEDREETLSQVVEWMLRTHAGSYLVVSAQPEKTLKSLQQICKPIEAAGGIVFNGKQELLMIHRLGKWDLPKGRVDPGETTDFTAIREVKEECGIADLKIIGPACNTYHIFSNSDKRVIKTTYWYQMEASGVPALVPQKEEFIEDAQWIDLFSLDIDKLVTFETIRGILRNLKNNTVRKDT